MRKWLINRLIRDKRDLVLEPDVAKRVLKSMGIDSISGIDVPFPITRSILESHFVNISLRRPDINICDMMASSLEEIEKSMCALNFEFVKPPSPNKD